MNPYVSITIRTFTIWIMASVINGLLCGTYLCLPGAGIEPVFFRVFIVGFFSLFFSVPGFFIFWIIMLTMIYRNIYGRSLFRAALSTAIILAGITGFLAIKILGVFKDFTIPCLTILSAVTSIMMHFNLFKKINRQ